MGKLANLLKWKKQITIVDNRGKELDKAWIRIIGDDDLKEAYRQARLASAAKRAALRDQNSIDYKDEVLPVNDSSLEECLAVCRAAFMNRVYTEAYAVVDREELPKIADIAVEPDGPSLEEQEKLDVAIEAVEQKYNDEIKKYVDDRSAVYEKELEGKTLDEIRKITCVEIANSIPFSIFISELNDQKAARSVYEDEKCTIKAFESVEAFKNAHSIIKEQIIKAYSEIEPPPDEVKN